MTPTGTFTVESPFAWNLSALYTTGEITLLATADFNGDSAVDAADLAAWQGDFGLNSVSDADSDGDSDGADFLAWQRQLGSPPAVAAHAAVPEPTSLILAVAAAAVAVRRRSGGGRMGASLANRRRGILGRHERRHAHLVRH